MLNHDGKISIKLKEIPFMLNLLLRPFQKETSDSLIDEGERCLKQLLPDENRINKNALRQYFEELTKADAIRESLEKHKVVIGKQLENKIANQTIWEYKLSGKRFSMVLFCYLALRLTKPDTVIETGCATGWMSALLLYALHRNKKGHLYSIDVPAKKGEFYMNWSLPDGLSPGFLVPEGLRDRWTLILGNTRQHLMPLLQEKKEIDAFLHDSDHTYHHMIWEYASVWPHLKAGGLLISDDITMNASFRDFAKGVGRAPVIRSCNPNFGAISKS